MGRALLLALILLAVPAVQAHDAAGVPTMLWLHDAGGIALMSPMPMAVEGAWPSGLASTSLCYPTPAGLITSYQVHTRSYQAVAGPVLYDPDAQRPLRASGSGYLAGDLVLDGSDAQLLFFLRTSAADRDTVAAVPRVVLDAALVEGQVHFREGEVLASASTEAADLSPLLSGHPEVEHMMDGESHVYAFRLRIPAPASTLDGLDGMFLRLTVAVEVPCVEGRAMPPLVEFHNREGFRPRLEVGIVDPVRILSMLPWLTEDGVGVTAVVSSPFGSADTVFTYEPMMVMRTGAAEVPSRNQTIRGDHASSYTGGEGRIFVDQSHGGKPRIVSTWAHPGPGLHEVVLRIPNQAGTFQATATATFEIGQATVGCGHAENGPACLQLESQPAQQSPLPLALLVVALALVASAKSSR